MKRSPTPAPRRRRTRVPSARGAPAAARQAALLRLSTAVAAAETERGICRAVTDGLYDEALGYDFLALLLVDDATGERELVASAGPSDVPSGLRIKPGSGLSERPLLDGRLHYTPQVTHDTRYLPTRNEGATFGTGEEAKAEAPLDLQEVARTAAGLLVHIDSAATNINDALNDARRTIFSTRALTNLSATFDNFHQVSERSLEIADSF